MILRMLDDNGQYNLYYFVADRLSPNRAISAIELFEKSDRMWTYATFIGTKTNTGISEDFDMYQGYIAGNRMVYNDANDDNKMVDSVMPIILNDAESCENYPNDEHIIRVKERSSLNAIFNIAINTQAVTLIDASTSV